MKQKISVKPRPIPPVQLVELGELDIGELVRQVSPVQINGYWVYPVVVHRPVLADDGLLIWIGGIGLDAKLFDNNR